MNKINFIVIFAGIIISSCSNDHTFSEKEYKSAQECHVIDSLSNDSIIVSYCKIKNEKGELIREGKYFHTESSKVRTAVGLHSFYKEGKKNKVIEYLPQGKDSSYLNNVYAFYPNGDTNYIESNFCLLSLNQLDNDSLQIKASLVAPRWKGSQYELYVVSPDDEEQVLVKQTKKQNCSINVSYTSQELKIMVREFTKSGTKTLERYYFFEKGINEGGDSINW